MCVLELARPRGFEPLTLGLEMRGFGYTNDLVLHRFVILQYLFYNVFTKMTHLEKIILNLQQPIYGIDEWGYP